MNSIKSKVGVAIPTYNRENYLRVLLNTIPDNVNVVISDNGNGCSDQFKEEFKNRRFIGTDQVIAPLENWNNAASNLETEWICLACDDDIFFENAFSEFHLYEEQYPDAEMIIFGHKNIDEEGKEVNSWKVDTLKVLDAPKGYEIFKYGVDARIIGVFFKKDLYERIGKFDEAFKVTASDSDFIQLALLNCKSVFVPKAVVGYRVWKNSSTEQTIATTEWMKEVFYWQSKIASALQKTNHSKHAIKKNTNEVIARNLFGGLSSLRKQKKGITNSLRFMLQFKYPIFATTETQLRIISCLLKTALKV
jgi:glycosyltransferase involved in cell wall biosynthesis